MNIKDEIIRDEQSFTIFVQNQNGNYNESEIEEEIKVKNMLDNCEQYICYDITIPQLCIDDIKEVSKETSIDVAKSPCLMIINKSESYLKFYNVVSSKKDILNDIYRNIIPYSKERIISNGFTKL